MPIPPLPCRTQPGGRSLLASPDQRDSRWCKAASKERPERPQPQHLAPRPSLSRKGWAQTIDTQTQGAWDPGLALPFDRTERSPLLHAALTMLSVIRSASSPHAVPAEIQHWLEQRQLDQNNTAGIIPFFLHLDPV